METDELKLEFANWLDTEYNHDIIELDMLDLIVQTAEPARNFITSLIYSEGITHSTCGEMPVTIIEGSRRYKGETRTDLFILDAGDCRLVYKQ